MVSITLRTHHGTDRSPPEGAADHPVEDRQGTVSLATWQKVGEEIREHYASHGPEKVPTGAFASWNLIKKVLELKQQVETLLQKPSNSGSQEESNRQKIKGNGKGYGTIKERDKLPLGEVDEDTPLIPKNERLTTPRVTLTSAPPDDDDILDPADQADLEEEAAKFNNKNCPSKLVAPTLRKNPSFKNPFVGPSESTPINKTQKPPRFQPPTPRFDQKTPTRVRAALQTEQGDTEFMCHPIIFGGEFDDKE
ncbi:Endogenous Retrovirus Group K Member 5 Gag Polyprotein [Manis pentadactyla]|nr:Endogenous Retrovirus Group K Member 5 Gag Polyprotein [Manis pentadactyla]